MSPAVGSSIRRRRGRSSPPGRPGVRWRRLAAYAVLAAGLGFAATYALAVLVLFPAPQASVPGTPVPRLLGVDTVAALRTLTAHGLRLGTVSSLPDPAASPGSIVAQDPLGGQELRSGSAVDVAVSGGPLREVLPDVTGYNAPRALALLAALGFQATQQAQPSPEPIGRVVGESPAPGATYQLPAPVMLLVSSGPPPPDSLELPGDSVAPGDTVPGAGAGPADLLDPGP